MKRKLNLPDHINLFGQTINVDYFPDQLYESGDESDGLAYFNRNQIQIFNPVDRPRSTLDMIYLHELTHFMVFLASNDSKATYSEPFIQATSVLLHQFLTTSDFRNETILIPNKFQCGALEIKVEWKKEVFNQNNEPAYAYTDLYSNRINVCLPDKEYGLQRIEVAFCLQLLVYFSYVLHDDMTAKPKNAMLYNQWPFLLHQILKQLIPATK